MSADDRELLDEAQKYMDGIGGQLSGIINPQIEAYYGGKKQQIALIKELFELENLELSQKISLIGADPLTMDLSVPGVMVPSGKTYNLKETEINTSMDISSHAESATKVTAETEVGASASYFGCGASFSAKAGAEHETRRSTDYSAKMSIRCVMGEDEPSEMMSVIADGCSEMIKGAIVMNKAIVAAKTRQTIEQIESGEIQIGAGEESETAQGEE